MINSIVAKNFFYIASENLNDVKSRFYGYCVTNQELYTRFMPQSKLINNYQAGVWGNIVDYGDEIVIQQDYFGSYGIYIYQNPTFWAISNSLFLLCKNLQGKYPLTMNLNYMYLYLLCEFVIQCMHETPFNEITELDPATLLCINKRTKKLIFIETPMQTSQIKIDSIAGMALIDSWQHKWASLGTTLISNGYDIQIELSGGKDSRASFAVIKSMPLDDPHVHFQSWKHSTHTYPEDYEIATKIATLYNFKLNTEFSSGKIRIPPYEFLTLDLYTRFMSHISWFYQPDYYKNVLFLFTGFGGEAFRSYRSYSLEPVLDFIKQKALAYSLSFGDDIASYQIKLYDYVNNKFKDDLDPAQKLWNYTRVKNHFGRFSLGYMTSNSFPLSPLMDPVLLRLDLTRSGVNDRDLFFAILYDRFIPEANKIKFDSGHRISNDTLQEARAINLKYPLQTNPTSEFQIFIENSLPDDYIQPWDIISSEYYMNSIIKSSKFKSHICSFLGDQIYTKIVESIYNMDSCPNIDCVRLFNIFVAQCISKQKF